MKSIELWNEKIQKPTDPNSTLTNQVMACTFLMDGQILLACVGDAVLIYETMSGEMQFTPLRGAHKDTITCVSSSKDGLKFATGSLDKTVVMWNCNPNKQAKQIEPDNKFTLSDAVHCLAFSPLKQQIFAGSSSDFALWQPGQAAIDKFKFKDKIISCAWSGDGQTLAFGTISGILVLTDRQGQSLREVQLPRVASIWCLEWSPITPDYQTSLLTVGVWGNSIYVFDAGGQQMGPRVELPMDALSINYATSGEYYAVSGNNNKVQLYNRDGQFLIEVYTANDWIWSVKLKPKSMVLASVTNDGEITVHQLQSDAVNALYLDKFVWRDQLTDVLITHMVTNQKTRIKCKELVKRVAIYKEKIAVMCGPRVLIYACVVSGEDFMKYKLFKKFTKRLESQHFLLSSSNAIITNGAKLLAYNFNGDLDRTWTFDSAITVIHMCGGPTRKELVLVGLENGSVYKVFLDNSFPILAHRVQQTIRKLDISMNKRRLAIIDGNSNLQVIDVITKENIFGEMGVEGVAFNQNFEDLIAYSGKGLLFVKCAQFPSLNQKITGNVIGFKGCKLFLSNGDQFQTIDVQQTANMLKYVEKKDFNNALKISCLGVTEADLRQLGIEALVNGEFDIAKRCFIRNKDYQYMDLLMKYEKVKLDPQSAALLNAEALAYQGRYLDAGNLLLKANLPDKAVELFTELKRWDDAKQFAKKGDVAYRSQTAQSRAGTGRLGTGKPQPAGKGGQPAISPPTDNLQANPKVQMNKLLKDQAEWTKETGDWKAAAELFVACGEYKKAIELYGQNKNVESLIDICRMIDRNDNLENIQLCATYFKKLKHHGGAKEAFLKLNDLRNLMILHIEFEKWEEAFAIGRSNPELLELAKVPYADYLLKSDKYEEALKAYKSAGRFDVTMKMTKDMCKNCLDEKRYQDASNHLWSLALDCLGQVQNYKNPNGDDISILKQYAEYSDTADIYFAYQKIHNFIEEPFQPLSGPAYLTQIMNSARFIISKWQSSYQGVKMSFVYYALAKSSKDLQCNKTARQCYDKLAQFKIPPEWSELIDLNGLLVRSQPFTDQDALLPLCQRCLTQAPLVSNSSICASCQHTMLSSFISFGVLPLVEFTVDGLSRREVEQILNREKTEINTKKQYQFTHKVSEAVEQQHTSDVYQPVVVDESILSNVNAEEIFIVDFTRICPSYQVKYYKNMMPELPIHNCQFCGRFFFLDEHEFEYIQKRECPFCRTKDKKVHVKDVFDI